MVTPDTLRWGGRARFDLVNPPRVELAAVYVADLDERPAVSSSEELIEVRWFPLEALPNPHSALDLAIAREVARSILREERGE